jgi:hypothetical protein
MAVTMAPTNAFQISMMIHRMPARSPVNDGRLVLIVGTTQGAPERIFDMNTGLLTYGEIAGR